MSQSSVPGFRLSADPPAALAPALAAAAPPGVVASYLFGSPLLRRMQRIELQALRRR